MNAIKNLSLRTALAFTLCALLGACSDSGKEQKSVQSDVVVIANKLNGELKEIRKEAELLAKTFEGFYKNQDELASKAVKSSYAMAPNGTYYKTVNDGESALWISGYTPITDEVIKIAHLTEAGDSHFKDLISRRPAAIQVYYNDRNCINRIYPWFDVLSQYQPKMKIPEFNFYYLADEKHNPERAGVWIMEPYIDPAGRGWIVSAIAPVYHEKRLEGVCGIDITVQTLASKYLSQLGAVFAIFTDSGTLVSADEKAMAIMRMPPLNSPKYMEAVNKDLYLMETYNISKSRSKETRKLGTDLIEKKLSETFFASGNDEYKVSSAKILELGWLLVSFEQQK